MRKVFEIRLIDRDQAERVARIIGPQSAHAKALADFDRRAGLGEDPIMGMRVDGVIIVVPRAMTSETVTA